MMTNPHGAFVQGMGMGTPILTNPNQPIQGRGAFDVFVSYRLVGWLVGCCC
jgi:hypothetical protein